VRRKREKGVGGRDSIEHCLRTCMLVRDWWFQIDVARIGSLGCLHRGMKSLARHISVALAEKSITVRQLEPRRP
jgi:hypothetical protein